MSYGFKIIVEADFACFTRPEMKVERVSYDVPTPSAIEGLLKSIYWKPSIRYIVDKIVVFNPINFINIRRNEVLSKVSISALKSQMKGGDKDPSIYSGDKSFISQRASMLLKDVKYGIEFHFEMTGICSENEDETEEKHYNILLRRLQKGQCFRQPYLGCREFSVSSIKLVNEFDKNVITDTLSGDIDLGYMLYGLKFKDNGIPINNDFENPKFSDEADAIYYRPHMIDGIIDVAKYREVIKC